MDPLEWLELGDVEKRNFRNRTLIPLLSSQRHVSEKEFGTQDTEKDSEFVESVVIFHEHRPNCEKLDWHGVSKPGMDRAWTDEQNFHAPGAFNGAGDEPIGFYPVLRKGFDTGEPTEWHLAQEIEFSQVF